jgi:regulatory protein
MMAIVTALKPQKHNSDRLNVFLDGEFAFGLAFNAASHLAIGQDLSADDVASLKQRDEFEKAKKSAVSLIGRRPRSNSEIVLSLRKKGFEDQIIDQVIVALMDVELLDDFAFASYWVEQRETFRPRSKLVLRQELLQKGVERAAIDAALIEVDEAEAAHRVAEKQAVRWAALSEKDFRVKLGSFLQRRGYPYDLIKQTTDDIWLSLCEENQSIYDQPDYEGDK